MGKNKKRDTSEAPSPFLPPPSMSPVPSTVKLLPLTDTAWLPAALVLIA